MTVGWVTKQWRRVFPPHKHAWEAVREGCVTRHQCACGARSKPEGEHVEEILERSGSYHQPLGCESSWYTIFTFRCKGCQRIEIRRVYETFK